jgi:hypothetical protein
MRTKRKTELLTAITVKTSTFWEVQQRNLTDLLEELAAYIFRIEVCATYGSDIWKIYQERECRQRKSRQ